MRQSTRRQISKSLRFAILVRDGFKCRYCGRAATEVPLVVDHCDPVCNGGRTSTDNLVTACQDCNIGKGGRLLPDICKIDVSGFLRSHAGRAGRPPISPTVIKDMRDRLRRGDSISDIVAATGASQAKVYEVRKYMEPA